VINVQPVVLEGQIVRLEPMGPQHLSQLPDCVNPDLFVHFAATRPMSMETSELQRYFDELLSLPNVIPYAIISRETGKMVGATSYMDIRAQHDGLEIGMTWLSKTSQGTKVNPECKLLLLQHAFEMIGCARVQLKTDGRNLQSQHAIEKLGAKKEGVLRKHMVMYDGFIRDTVMYSILPDEWPAVKEGLLARLA